MNKKFRYWNGERWVEKFAVNPDGSVHLFVGDLPKKSNGQLVQFTGLTGKNGVEIYEGDIVSVSHPSSKFKGDIAKIQFHNGSFIMASVDFEDDYFEYICFDFYIDVIGNIYENGDLLEGEK